MSAGTYFITERGLRASGAASMRAAAKNLCRTAAELDKSAKRLDQEMAAPTNGSDPASGATPPRVFRRGTVCGRYRDQHRVPALGLSGKWGGPSGSGVFSRTSRGGPSGSLPASNPSSPRRRRRMKSLATRNDERTGGGGGLDSAALYWTR